MHHCIESGLRVAAKALRVKLADVEPFATRDEIATAANRMRTVSDRAYFNAGLAFGVTFADLKSVR